MPSRPAVWRCCARDSTSDRPRPYGEPALADLTPDAEHLVPLCEFEFDGCRLVRNGHAFLMLSSDGLSELELLASQSCYSEGCTNMYVCVSIPFCTARQSRFARCSNAMLVYGQPLDWNRIDGLHTTDHGRWCPAASNASSKFTDYAWTPRRSEVHFVCGGSSNGRHVDPPRRPVSSRNLRAVGSRRVAPRRRSEDLQ